MSRTAAKMCLAAWSKRSVAVLLMLAALASPAAAVADTTTACASGDNTSTTYCPTLEGGTDDESAVFAGLAGGAVVGFGILTICSIALLYRKFTSAGLR
jgi:hypothetical protein